MPHPTNLARKRRAVRALGTVAILLAGSAVGVVAGTAIASSFTLRVAKNVHVTNASLPVPKAKPVNTNATVAVGPNGFAVYTFQGEFVRGNTRHLICHKTTNMATNCWAFWPPVSPSSAKNLTKAPAIKGKLGTFHNHGILQLTLNGKPLYYFAPDIKVGNKHMAQGDELNTFGSIWHAVYLSSGSGQTTTSTTTTTTPGYSMTTTTMTTTTTPGYSTPTSVSNPTTTPGY